MTHKEEDMEKAEGLPLRAGKNVYGLRTGHVEGLLENGKGKRGFSN